MKIKFALNISDKVNKFVNAFNEFEDKINPLIRNKEYGKNLSVIYVGWICVAPEYEPFFKPRKPRYYHSKEMSVNGHKYRFENTLEYEIKIDYNNILNSSYDEFKLILIKTLVDSLISVIKGHKKIKDFNLDELIRDIKSNE